MIRNKQTNGGSVETLVDGGDDFRTFDINLASALMAVGIPPVGPVVTLIKPNEPGEWKQFYLAPRSECGKYETRKLVKHWREGLDFVQREPEHPFSVAMAAMMNRKNLIDGIKDAEDVAFIKRGKSVGVLPVNASLAAEEIIFGKGRMK